jgi:hypothetical protein
MFVAGNGPYWTDFPEFAPSIENGPAMFISLFIGVN